MIEQERKLSERFGVPFIFLARPGAYGSSGKFFTSRSTPREADIVEAALNALKTRYGIGSWALGGHSGEGGLAAEMLARRNDIRCAILSIGSEALHAYMKINGFKPGPIFPQVSFDPLVSLDDVPINPNRRRIFVIGDPRDREVAFSTPHLYYDGLVLHGHSAQLVPLQRGRPPEHHSMVDIAETATGLCAKGVGSDNIVATLKAMPDQVERISN